MIQFNLLKTMSNEDKLKFIRKSTELQPKVKRALSALNRYIVAEHIQPLSELKQSVLDKLLIKLVKGELK